MWLPFVNRPLLYLLNKQITSICWSLVLENCQHVLCSVLISIVIERVNGVLIKALLHWFDRGLRLDLTNWNPTYIPFLFILCCVRKSVVNAFCLKTDVFRFIGVNIHCSKWYWSYIQKQDFFRLMNKLLSDFTSYVPIIMQTLY